MDKVLMRYDEPLVRHKVVYWHNGNLYRDVEHAIRLTYEDGIAIMNDITSFVIKATPDFFSGDAAGKSCVGIFLSATDEGKGGTMSAPVVFTILSPSGTAGANSISSSVTENAIVEPDPATVSEE